MSSSQQETSESASLEPQTAVHETVNRYLNEREENGDHSFQTRRRKRNVLGQFANHVATQDVTTVEELTPRHIGQYLNFLQREAGEDGDGYKLTTVESRMKAVRAFLNWCKSEWLVEDRLIEAVDKKIPEAPDEEWQRDSHIKEERAERILNQLEKWDYASRKHVVYLLMYRVGLRRGACLAIDVGDFHPQKKTIEIKHRPPETPLKNGRKSRRDVNITADTAGVIQDYIHHNRKEPDPERYDSDRNPLLSSYAGRVDASVLYRDVTEITACEKCWTHGTGTAEDGTCEGHNRRKANKCPLSIGPHDLRRSGITRMANDGWPIEAIAERTDTSRDQIEKRYNQQSEEEKAEQRRQYLGE